MDLLKTTVHLNVDGFKYFKSILARDVLILDTLKLNILDVHISDVLHITDKNVLALTTVK